MFKNKSGPNKFKLGVGKKCLRDFFAAKAMSEMIARWSKDEFIHEASIAEFAYRMADAMLRQRGL